MAITFDPAKRDWTLKNRSLDFADAEALFSGRTVTMIDDRFDYGEERQITVGFLRGRTVIVVWTDRGADRHVISMRHCHEKEERRWRKILR